MNPSNPPREEALFQLALEKPVEKRPAFLDAMCEGDQRIALGPERVVISLSADATCATEIWVMQRKSMGHSRRKQGEQPGG